MPQIKPEVFLDYLGTAKQAANTTLPYEANIVNMLAKNVANLHTQQTLSDISIYLELRVRSNFHSPCTSVFGLHQLPREIFAN